MPWPARSVMKKPWNQAPPRKTSSDNRIARAATAISRRGSVGEILCGAAASSVVTNGSVVGSFRLSGPSVAEPLNLSRHCCTAACYEAHCSQPQNGSSAQRRTAMASVTKLKPPAAGEPKDLYDIGEVPPLGHVPARMHAWAIRKERHGPPELSMQ